MRYHRIPDETIKRLPVYLRGAMRLSESGVRCVSSKQLAEQLGVMPWQIRKDLSYFGGFGTRGVGYDLQRLIDRIRGILRLKAVRKAALVGVGNLGSALLAFPGFGPYWLEIAAAFDVDKKKIGKERNGIIIEDFARIETLRDRGVDLGIIAVPAEVAQEVADKMINVGIKAILNFAPRYISVPPRIKVITIDIALYLARLPYYLPSR